MKHLNEDKLIQYAFNLMDAETKEAAQQHLDDCGDCREVLAALRAKFAVMDVLGADEVPSEELIRNTLSVKSNSVGGAHPTKQNIPLYRRAWVEWSAAAAAVAIICILMLQGLPDTRVRQPEPGMPTNQMFAKKLDTPGNYPGLQSSPPAKGESPEGGRGLNSASQLAQNSVGTAHPTGVRVVSADEIPEVPPFAPASAIELVVLPKPDKTQVTIYNSADLTLVRDTRKLTLKPGWNWIQFMWDNTLIDPTSLSLTPLEHADKVDIELISYPARLKDIGRWLIRSEVEGAVPFEITYFASGLSWRAFYMGTMNEDETTMNLKGYVNVSNHSGQDFKNTQTRLIVGETRLTEEIRTLAQRRYPYGPEIQYAKEINFPRNWKEISKKRDQKIPDTGVAGQLGGAWSGAFDADVDYSIKQIEKTGLSEYFLYTIEGTEDLTNQWTKRLPSFDVADIPVKSLYKYDDARYGKEPVRFVSFKNDTEHELGETPIPEGAIKIYRNVNDQQKTMWHGLPARDSRPGWPCHLSYIGGSHIKYIPVNEDIELNLGPARLVKVEPVLMATQTENHTFDAKGNIDGWDEIESYQITVTNTRQIPIDLEFTWNMGTDAWELELNPSTSPSQGRSLVSSPPAKGESPEGGRGLNAADNVVYKKLDAKRARLTLTVPPRSESRFEASTRKYRQKRIEAYVEKMQEHEK